MGDNTKKNSSESHQGGEGTINNDDDHSGSSTPISLRGSVHEKSGDGDHKLTRATAGYGEKMGRKSSRRRTGSDADEIAEESGSVTTAGDQHAREMACKIQKRYTEDEATNSFGEPLEVSLKNANTRYRSIQRSLSKPMSLSQQEAGDRRLLFDLSAWMRNRESAPDEEYAKKLGLVFNNLYVYGSSDTTQHIQTLITPFYHFLRTIRDIFLLVVNSFLVVFGFSPVFQGKGKCILHDISGFCSEGEMLLVLGKPGSGCSTLLRVLGNDRRTYSRIDGDVSYGGIGPKEMHKNFRGEVAYNQEEDLHYPELTVRTTLSFAIECKMPSRRVLRDRSAFRTELLDAVIDMFGLRSCADTIVGNAFIRGCSGGERKRVSIAEQIVAGAAVNVWDGSTRGLDSSSALDYVRSLRVSTDMLKKTTVVTLYQASENIYKLFDKVLVLDEGRCLYFGHADHAVEYFDKLGIYKPPRLTTSDFLTGVAQLHERQVKRGYEDTAPKTAEEFATAFKNSEAYEHAKQEIRNYEHHIETENPGQKFRDIVQQSKMGAGKSRIRRVSPYTTTFTYQFWALIKRELRIVLGNRIGLVFRYVYNIAFAIISGTLYINLPSTSQGAFSRGGAVFFTVLFNSLSAQAELPKSITGREIVYKHKGLALYHPSAYLLAQVIIDIPFMVVQILCFSSIFYWVTGLFKTGGHFFTFMVITFMTAMSLTAFFRLVAAVSYNIDIANSISGICLLFIVLYAGYIIPYPSMRSWFIWIHWINPIAYGFRGLFGNEFSSLILTCAGNQLAPRGPGYGNIANQVCTLPGSRPGTDIVRGRDYIYEGYAIKASQKWAMFLGVLGWWVAYVTVTAILNEWIQFGGEGYTIKAYKKRVKPPVEVMESIELVDEKAREYRHPTDKEILDGTLYLWRNVNYVVPVKGGKRKLLDSITGFVKPGTLTALMGASGAGKTTLLDVLAQRKTIGKIDGEMLINGIPPPKSFARVTGYCEQLDIHNPHSTVREALRFSAYLRQESSVPQEQKDEDVERAIKLLDMEDIANALIGQPEGGLGISLEERKRLTIAVELVAKPKILFLDEPTSGLDAQAAFNIVFFLRRLAATGEIILCTIHQPSSTLFEHFDRLLLLTRGGHTTYFGDIGKDAQTLISYFERNGAPKCSPDANPAEYILDVVSSSQGSLNWPEIWNNSPEKLAVEDEAERLYQLEKKHGTHRLSDNDNRQYSTSVFYQLKIVYSRMLLSYWRNRGYNLTRMALQIFAALVIGFTFYRLANSVVNLQNKVFAVFQTATIAILIINQVEPEFARQRLWYSRESSTNQYGWAPFAISIVLAEWPFAIFAATLYFTIFYWVVGLNTLASRTGFFYLMYITLCLFSVSLGQLIISFLPTHIFAALVNPIFTTMMLLFSGVVQPYPVMPKWWRRWMYWISPLHYYIEGVVVNELKGQTVVCRPREFYIFEPPVGQTCGEYAGPFLQTGPGYIDNLNDTTGCRYCPYKIGEEFYFTLDWSFAHRYRNWLIVVGYTFFNIALVIFFVKVYRINKR
ncbi:ATP-binding cassette transporter snq2 [Mycoemilia scoparia]|uniref:ATP-binding cassette transporter snq2 n=1 Tax=Mycoemilia scoparia TaxID=417184 RepID=A0A9W7ZYM1_9FUNG|nr:ATP-binding cassette transporter snq2 [Mycoemilia scoparia]